MAANPTPTSNPVLLALCNDLAGGCHALETEIGILRNTETVMRAAIGDVGATFSLLGKAKMAMGKARKDFKKADADGERVISDCRLRLARIFGSKFSSKWEAAGFRHRSTAVPEVAAVRFSLLESLSLYFTASPAHESADMGATAAICHAMHEALSDARSAVNRAKSEQRAAVKAMRDAYKKLRARARSLIGELWIVLPETDARWKRFGLNIPARLSMPEAVSAVTLKAGTNGDVQIDWPPAAHARRYRIQMRRIGMETEFINIKTLRGTSHLLRKQTAGQTIEIRVIAANKTGEAPPSPVARVELRADI